MELFKVKFNGHIYNGHGEFNHKGNYNYEKVYIIEDDYDQVGYGKYRYMNRPWQRFDYAEALREAVISWFGKQASKKIEDAIDSSSNCQQAMNKFFGLWDRIDEDFDDDDDRPFNGIVVEYICPLTVSAMDYDYEEPYEMSPWEANNYKYSIRRALDKEHSYDGCDPKSMASYQDNPKVEWVRFDVDRFDGKLCGVVRVGLKEELNAKEEAELRRWIEGQCSDGFGEGFEQADIKVDDGDRILNVSFWNPDDFWSLKRRK